MKKLLSVIVLLVVVFSLVACGGKSSKNEIPDVFGVNYEAAVALLEAEGFTVSAVETSVESFSTKLLYPLEHVEKGAVFKIDDYIIDNNGNLNKNYDVFYDDGLVSEDKSLVIYYAKEEYTLEKKETPAVTLPEEETPTEPTTEEPTDLATEPVTEPTTEPTTEPPTEPATEDQNLVDGMRPEFKAAMDSYEEFMDEYVNFMKKYMDNPSDLTMLGQYAKLMSEYYEFVEEFEEWDNEDLNNVELAYYAAVQTRVAKKLASIA